MPTSCLKDDMGARCHHIPPVARLRFKVLTVGKKRVINLSALGKRRGSHVENLLRPNREAANMSESEEREDCFILDSDPNDSLDHLSKLSIATDLDASDISVLAEKGQVACRDYPHSRHLCFKNPFGKTPHESYCQLCYCFVCDKVAPCKSWSRHCHAIDDEIWSYLGRERRKEREETITEPVNSLRNLESGEDGILFMRKKGFCFKLNQLP